MLFYSAQRGDIDGMMTAKTDDGTTINRALRLAASHNQLDAMRVLIDWGAWDFDAAFLGACKYGCSEAMSLLIIWGVNDVYEALQVAAENEQKEAILLLAKWLEGK